MAQLADQLSLLAEAGTAITFDALGLSPDVVVGQSAQVAAGPFAPFLAEALAHAFDHDDQPLAAAEFAAGLADQTSVLHLTGALETLLASTTTVTAMAKPLHDVLLAGVAGSVAQSPLLAAARLEGTVRLAVSKAVTPFALWAALENLPSNAPEDFDERLPRVLGVALDCWSGESAVADAIRAQLRRLSATDGADTDAMFELGCDELRAALAGHDTPSVTGHLAEARALFATVVAAEEARHDAQAYAAVCDAITAFTAGDAVGVGQAADRLEWAVTQHHAWMAGLHQPAWLRPRLSAEIAWHGLVLQLQAAADRLDQDVWMDGAWSALDAVLNAYAASRTVHPVGGADELRGLATLIEPAIEDSFLRKQALLETLRYAATHRPQPDGFSADTATVVLANVESRAVRLVAGSARARRTPGAQEEQEDPASAADPEPRLHELAPSLVRALGVAGAASVARNLDDEDLRRVEGLVHDGDTARLRSADPVITPLTDRLMRELGEHEHFTGQVRQTFSVLVDQTLKFLKSRADLTSGSLVGRGAFDYRRKPESGERDAVEADLQRDFHHWLLAGPLYNAVSVEPIDLALGRADVLVQLGPLRYLTEIKKDSELRDLGTTAGREKLEAKYLAQAAEYSNTNTPFGQLLLLDLSSKDKTGTLRVDELVWTTLHRPTGATVDRAVVVGVVTGNRPTPSAYSA